MVIPEYFLNIGPPEREGTHLSPVNDEVIQKFGNTMQLFRDM